MDPLSYLCHVVTCWDRSDLLALLYVVFFFVFVTFHVVFWVRCGIKYRFLIFTFFLTLIATKRYNLYHIIKGKNLRYGTSFLQTLCIVASKF